MAAHGASPTVGNFIIETGVMGYMRQSIERGGGLVRFIPVVDRSGAIAWPDKFVKTDPEALDANRSINGPALRKISLESKRRELNAGGRRVYEVEMLLDPMAAGSVFFDRSIIDRLMAQACEPKETKTGFQLWGEFNPSHRYGIGADTGKGNGGDHGTSVLIDFSTASARQVGSFANNEMPADQFAYELRRQGDLFGTCLIAPEKNSESGGSCLTTLKMNPADRIYRQGLGSVKLGWETIGATFDADRCAPSLGKADLAQLDFECQRSRI